VVAGTLLAFGIDFLMYGVFMADSMKEMEKFYASVMYPEGQRPSEAWFIVYELCRMLIIGMVVLQRPMKGLSSFVWGFAVSSLLTICMDFWWMMFFNDPNMSVGHVAMEAVMGGVIMGLCAWLMSMVYSKLST